MFLNCPFGRASDIFACSQGASSFAADQGSLPIAGSIFSAIVLAFLCTSVLISVYMAFMAVPEGASTYVFMEPRGLILMNGLVAFGTTQSVEKNFARCSNDAAGATFVFALFCLLACWLDELPNIAWSAAVWAGLAKKKEGEAEGDYDGAKDEAGEETRRRGGGAKRRGPLSPSTEKIYRYSVLQILSLVPLIGLIATHTQWMPSAVLVSFFFARASHFFSCTSFFLAQPLHLVQASS